MLAVSMVILVPAAAILVVSQGVCLLVIRFLLASI